MWEKAWSLISPPPPSSPVGTEDLLREREPLRKWISRKREEDRRNIVVGLDIMKRQGGVITPGEPTEYDRPEDGGFVRVMFPSELLPTKI